MEQQGTKTMKTFTREEVAKHNKPDDLWVIIDNEVYDLSRFAQFHPGGLAVLFDTEVAGQDATESFFGLHRYEVLEKPNHQRLKIGSIIDEKPSHYGRTKGELSKVPYGEPTWLSEGYHSPYYKESHRALQKAMRKFVDEVIYPDAQVGFHKGVTSQGTDPDPKEREEDGKRPSQSVLDAMAGLNIHAMRLGPGKHLQGLTLMNGIVTPEEFDYFHELVITHEIVRCGARGYGDGLLAGKVIGLPPLLNFASEELKARVVPDILAGKKYICLAISEAFAGSDVMGMQTHAEKSEDGKFWIVNGTKKWITNGMFADYFTVGCKTEEGFTVILVERGEGVETKLVKTSYSPTAGSAYVTFDNVKVPVENTLGKEGGGIFVILSNFNHERWVMCCASARSQRGIVEECLKWANQRKVFGRRLSSQAVVRNKLAHMITRVETAHAWLENITYQMTHMSYKEQASKLPGQIALLKMYCTQSAQKTAEDATQLFGGRGITRTGMGRLIEHYHRVIAFDALLGGAEDVMGDLGVRQAMRSFPTGARL